MLALFSACIILRFVSIFREKKKDKERDELWKKLDNLALNHKGKK